ncbi:hypothetical protein ABPG75_000855 [Micractinium tetrahymenae]
MGPGQFHTPLLDLLESAGFSARGHGVWNYYIRPYLAPGELLVLPCESWNAHDGAGYPGLPANCSGTLVSHYWGWDGHAKATAAMKAGILNEQLEGAKQYAGLAKSKSALNADYIA